MKKIVAGILRRDGRVLICQRARGQVQGLKWEFPGGKVEPGEDERAALERELREELDVRAVVGPLLVRLRHRYSETGELDLAFYEITGFDGEPRNCVFETIVWERVDRLRSYDFLAADGPVVDLLAGSRPAPPLPPRDNGDRPPHGKVPGS